MAITFVQERKKQRYLIIIFVIILLVTAVVWWRGFFKKEKILFPIPVAPAPKEVKINLNLLGSDTIKELETFLDIATFEGAAGRENPFISY